MQTVRTNGADSHGIARPAMRAALVAVCMLLVAGCNTVQPVATVSDTPYDHRMRHPITITEGERTHQIFIGANRGTLTPAQRAEVLEFAQGWKHEATGGVIIDLPVGSSNERSSAEALHEVQSIIAATGVPPQAIAVRNYHVGEGSLATIRITYPKISAQAGPCGLWPQDIGPTANREYFENNEFWNLGCASQRNLAAMVENPADLVQPRGETPAYEPRRTTAVEKYRQGTGPATIYQNANGGKITDIGQ